MSNKYNLYPFCDKWFEKGGSIWITSDPHFNDPDVEKFRHNNITPEEWIKKQNRKCGKNDTLVILGDIGDVSYVSKLRAGYKVLITGNHDSGVSNYKRIRTKIEDSKCICCKCGNIVEPDLMDAYNCGYDSAYCRHCGSTEEYKFVETKYDDNHLFDEVYDGVLTISSNIKLSHEQDPDKYHLNIHGHQHGEECRVIQEMFKMYDRDLNTEDYIKAQLDTIKTKGLMEMNCCTEWLGYEPVNLGDIIKSGILKNIPDIHREAIDKQTENSIKKKAKL